MEVVSRFFGTTFDLPFGPASHFGDTLHHVVRLTHGGCSAGLVVKPPQRQWNF